MEQRGEQKNDSQAISKVNVESSGDKAKVQDTLSKNNPKDIEIESKKPIQKIDLPKDPNSGFAKK